MDSLCLTLTRVTCLASWSVTPVTGCGLTQQHFDLLEFYVFSYVTLGWVGKSSYLVKFTYSYFCLTCSVSKYILEFHLVRLHHQMCEYSYQYIHLTCQLCPLPIHNPAVNSVALIDRISYILEMSNFIFMTKTSRQVLQVQLMSNNIVDDNMDVVEPKTHSLAQHVKLNRH